MTDTCMRCGRKLVTAVSKARGYGTKCWEKSQRERFRQEVLCVAGESTVSDPVIAQRVRGEIMRKIPQGLKCRCDTLFSTMDLHLEDHGWVPLAGYEKPQFVFLACHKCGYGWAWYKFGPPLDDLAPGRYP